MLRQSNLDGLDGVVAAIVVGQTVGGPGNVATMTAQPPPPPPTGPPPGWYSDPDIGPSRRRYFDGVQWTERYSTPTGVVLPPPGQGAPARRDSKTLSPPALRRRYVGIAAAILAAIGVVVLTLKADGIIFKAPPPPDEDAYVEELFTSKFDVLLPKRPFIEEGYAACELLREGHTEEQAAVIMWQRGKWTSGEPEAIRERLLEQAVAAHKHLCPDA